MNAAAMMSGYKAVEDLKRGTLVKHRIAPTTLLLSSGSANHTLMTTISAEQSGQRLVVMIETPKTE